MGRRLARQVPGSDSQGGYGFLCRSRPGPLFWLRRGIDWVRAFSPEMTRLATLEAQVLGDTSRSQLIGQTRNSFSLHSRSGTSLAAIVGVRLLGADGVQLHLHFLQGRHDALLYLHRWVSTLLLHLV